MPRYVVEVEGHYEDDECSPECETFVIFADDDDEAVELAEEQMRDDYYPEEFVELYCEIDSKEFTKQELLEQAHPRCSHTLDLFAK